jgi:hypothetical protein
MERPYPSIEESREYEDWLDARHEAGEEWASFEDFRRQTAPAPQPVPADASEVSEDDIPF